jgi:ankyrin repeat protein
MRNRFSNKGDNVEAKAGNADKKSIFDSFRETPNDSPPRRYNPVRSIVEIGEGKLPFPNLKSIVLNAFASERYDEIEAAKFLIKQHDVNQADEEGKTLLHYACDNGNADLVKFLIEMKVDVNQVTNDGRSPIDIACLYYNIETVQMLFNAGTNVKPGTTEELDYERDAKKFKLTTQNYCDYLNQIKELGKDDLCLALGMS